MYYSKRTTVLVARWFQVSGATVAVAERRAWARVGCVQVDGGASGLGEGHGGAEAAALRGQEVHLLPVSVGLAAVW
eukprot:2400318-Rhodomonas_salina.1